MEGSPFRIRFLGDPDHWTLDTSASGDRPIADHRECRPDAEVGCPIGGQFQHEPIRLRGEERSGSDERPRHRALGLDLGVLEVLGDPVVLSGLDTLRGAEGEPGQIEDMLLVGTRGGIVTR